MKFDKDMRARFHARDLRVRVRRCGDPGAPRVQPEGRSMTVSTYRVGEFVVSIEYDDSFQAFRGAVANHGYAVTLHAQSVDELKSKFRRLLTGYFGARAA